MQITVTITDKAIKSAIRNTLDNEVYENYDSAVLRAAKMPKISTAANAIFDNAKFQASLTKQLQRVAESAMEDEIFDAMWDVTMPGIPEMVKACDAAAKARDADEREKQDAEEVKRMVKALERAGFKISKG
jgi:maltooligosyltrehalose synthase